MNTKNTAVIFLQYQNDFLNPKGVFYPLTQKVLDKNQMEEKSKIFLDNLRKNNIRRIFVNLEFDDNFYNSNPIKTGFGIFKKVMKERALTHGSWGAEQRSGFEIIKNDKEVFLKGKNDISAFSGTHLEQYLRENHIDNIGVCGLLSNCCVDSTLRDGYRLGLNVYSIYDCQATLDYEAHLSTHKYGHPNYSILLSHTDFMSELKKENNHNNYIKNNQSNELFRM